MGSLNSRWNQRLVEAEGWWSPQFERASTHIRNATGSLLSDLCRSHVSELWLVQSAYHAYLSTTPPGYWLSVMCSSSWCAREHAHCDSSLSFKLRHRGAKRAVLLCFRYVEILEYSFIISKFKLMSYSLNHPSSTRCLLVLRKRAHTHRHM